MCKQGRAGIGRDSSGVMATVYSGNGKKLFITCHNSVELEFRFVPSVSSLVSPWRVTENQVAREEIRACPSLVLAHSNISPTPDNPVTKTHPVCRAMVTKKNRRGNARRAAVLCYFGHEGKLKRPCALHGIGKRGLWNRGREYVLQYTESARLTPNY